jgi:hypothetical protein
VHQADIATRNVVSKLVLNAKEINEGDAPGLKAVSNFINKRRKSLITRVRQGDFEDMYKRDFGEAIAKVFEDEVSSALMSLVK